MPHTNAGTEKKVLVAGSDALACEAMVPNYQGLFTDRDPTLGSGRVGSRRVGLGWLRSFVFDQ